MGWLNQDWYCFYIFLLTMVIKLNTFYLFNYFYIIRGGLTLRIIKLKDKKELLLEVYENISNMRLECVCNVKETCAASELTVRQIEYLKIIDKYKDITFSRLAELTNNSKPTITEMINKFINLNMVYREKSLDDGRISYILLTDQGKMIARYERITMERIVDRVLNYLTEEEIDTLLTLLAKVK